jgi:uncharacterized membrane protein
MKAKIRRQFLAGLIVFIPVALATWLFVWFFRFVDALVQPVLEHFLGYTVPGIGFMVAGIIIYVIGLIALSFIGKMLLGWGDSVLSKIPMFSLVYRSIKQIMESFAKPDKSKFKRVVIIEYPRKGMKTIALVTKELVDESGEKIVHIFVPTSPNPMSGYFEIMKEEDVTNTDLTIENAMKLVISCGAVESEVSDNETGESEK